ncbi:E3 ubiquitin-protein ligase DTX3L-like [Glandiceps talaboti]
MNTLHCASSIGARSLATPIISSGVYGFPVKVCARVFRTTLEEFSKKEGATTSLRDIRIVNNNAETQKEFIDEFTATASSVAEADLHRRKRIPADTVINMEGVNTSDEDFTTPAQLKSNRNEDDGCFVSMESDESSHKRRKAHTSMTGPKSTYFPPATTTTTSILSSPNSNASSKPNTVSPAPTTAAIASQSGRGDCPICVDDDVPLMSMKCCQNTICNNCFARHFDTDAKCPFCTLVVLMKKGNQPPGTMDCSIDECSSLPGYEGMGIIIITYHFPNGIQKEHHPNPGVYYSGTSRRAYLPANKEGRQVLELLQRGFDQKVLFTIGKSVTTGQDNCVLWNDVHHKTNTRGGPAQYGYPDPTYLSRVKGELAAKGIK